MQIVIDIPEEDYEYLKLHNKDGLYNAILNGKPLPKDPTNGDMIKAIFPKYYQAIFPKYSQTMLGYLNYTRWWNTPYKEEGAE